MQQRRIVNHYKHFFGLLRIIILAALLAACNLPRPKPSPTAPALTNTPTNTPLQPLPPTNTPAPQPSPTATTQSNPGGITNLLFAPGTTAVVAQGSLQPGQSQTYTLEAGQNQAMILLLSAPNTDAYLGVFEPNGTALLDPNKVKWNAWQYLLPQTELYTIKVYAGAQAANYVLTAKVAAPITFAAGATTATVNGSTPKGYVITYSVYANAGQTMSVSVNAPGNTVALDIFGLAYGESLLGISADAVTWTGKLPSTENYIIEVVPNGGQVVNFTLNISIK